MKSNRLGRSGIAVDPTTKGVGDCRQSQVDTDTDADTKKEKEE